MKFHLCKDLAMACKVTVSELLRHASHKIFGCIMQLTLMNTDVIKVISEYLGLEYF